MKKNIFKLALGLAVAVATGYTVYASQIRKTLVGIDLENVEALANGEDPWDPFCYAVYDEWCTFPVITPDGNYVVSKYDHRRI